MWFGELELERMMLHLHFTFLDHSALARSGVRGEDEPTFTAIADFDLKPQLNSPSISYELITMRPSQIMRSGGDGEIGKYGK